MFPGNFYLISLSKWGENHFIPTTCEFVSATFDASLIAIFSCSPAPPSQIQFLTLHCSRTPILTHSSRPGTKPRHAKRQAERESG
jgi:hypothetical protein